MTTSLCFVGAASSVTLSSAETVLGGGAGAPSLVISRGAFARRTGAIFGFLIFSSSTFYDMMTWYDINLLVN